MHKQKTKVNPVLTAAIFVLILVVIFSGLKIMEATVFGGNRQEDIPVPSKTITRDGVNYFPRQDITTLLILGTDRRGVVESSGSYNNTGAADVVMLAILDEVDQSVSVIALNRDTMVNMPVLGLNGKQADTRFGQLAVSHSYGSGLEDSSENVKKTVSDFLYGITIDYYVTFNMDAIGILNDAVGGVQVTVTDDFSEVNPPIPMGPVQLNAQQAIEFVQTRYGVGNQLNVSRMERQKDYITGFLDALQNKMKGEQQQFAIDTYNALSDYMVTDCSSNTMSNIAERFSDYTLKEIVSPEGENRKGSEYMEFYVDEEALDALILRLLYAPKH